MSALLNALESRLARSPEPVSLVLPDGRQLGPTHPAVRLVLHNWMALKDLVRGEIGAVAEGIVEGRIACEGSMRAIMGVAGSLLRIDPRAPSSGVLANLLRTWRSARLHSRARDAAQIQQHYDVSDDFYKLWLDEKRVYSCAYYRESGMGLGQAQEAKLDHICRKLLLQPGQRFLDIGAGWGGLLFWAAENYGVDATGITLSRNQHTHLEQQIESRRLQGRVRALLVDYRDLADAGGFDKIASVGMFEHVGLAHMPAYFEKISRLLRPGGLLLNHGITAGGVANHQLGAGLGDFIEKYIFPGGELLHVSQVAHDMAGAGLELVDMESLRPHYARTLWAWSDALEARQAQARAVLRATAGTRAEEILQAYRLYLAGSAMGFERGWMSLYQLLAAKPDGSVSGGALPGAQSAYPFARGYMYAPSPLSRPQARL